MNINLTPIFEAIIALLAAIITYKVIPWIKERTTKEQFARLEAAARVAVFAAEQLYGAGKGDEKFRYAQEYLARKGFDIDAAEIEAAVARYLNYAPAIELVMEAEDATDDN